MHAGEAPVNRGTKNCGRPASRAELAEDATEGGWPGTVHQHMIVEGELCDAANTAVELTQSITTQPMRAIIEISLTKGNDLNLFGAYVSRWPAPIRFARQWTGRFALQRKQH